MPHSQTFSFTIPPGWGHERDGTRDVYYDDSGAVIIVSASAVDPPSPDIAARLLNNAFTAVESAAADPGLATVEALAERPAPPGLRAWSMTSRSTDGMVWFSQAVVAANDAVLLATVESPGDEGRHARLVDAFLGSVGRAGKG